MTIFTSRSAESYDPEPYQCVNGTRLALMPRDRMCRCLPVASGPHIVYARRRPEFEPTRDEFPWKHPDVPEGREVEGLRYSYPIQFLGGRCVWAPRDRNRNRILIALRDEFAWTHHDGPVPMIERIRMSLDALVIRRNVSGKDSFWGVEIKVSAADLRHELKTPEKTAAWAQYVDSFYFLVPPALKEIALAEIPAQHGVLVGGLYTASVVRRPQRNGNPLPLPLDTWRRMAASLGKIQVDTIAARESSNSGRS